MILYKNKHADYPNYIELFGLSKSGKTSLTKILKKKIRVISVPKGFFSKIGYFIKFLFKKPVVSYLLFLKLNSEILDAGNIKDNIKVFFMRNSYLAAVLSKYERILLIKYPLLVDEFFLQSLFMIFQKKANHNEIIKIMDLLPMNHILVIEIPNNLRKKRLQQVGFPGGNINRIYARKWMENMEYNYKLIIEILEKSHDKLLLSNKDLLEYLDSNFCNKYPYKLSYGKIFTFTLL